MKILIDSSYYNFYRFFATVSWYNYSPERQEVADGLEWLKNSTFMATFEKMWFENIKKITKKFGVQTSDLIFARDGRNVWRYKIYPEYKANRSGPPDTDPHAPGPVFKHINTNFHKRLEGAKVLQVDTAEGDDIIAVAVRYIRTVSPDTNIVIISGDHDLLQLSDPPHVEIYQLKGWKNITADPRVALLTKILAGDPSDNIPPIYKGCGKKTARALAQNQTKLQETLRKHHEQYNFNRTLVDFECIPPKVIAEIEELLDEIIL